MCKRGLPTNLKCRWDLESSFPRRGGSGRWEAHETFSPGAQREEIFSTGCALHLSSEHAGHGEGVLERPLRGDTEVRHDPPVLERAAGEAETASSLRRKNTSIEKGRRGPGGSASGGGRTNDFSSHFSVEIGRAHV